MSEDPKTLYPLRLLYCLSNRQCKFMDYYLSWPTHTAVISFDFMTASVFFPMLSVLSNALFPKSQLKSKLTVWVWPNFSERNDILKLTSFWWLCKCWFWFQVLNRAFFRLTTREKCGGRFSLALFCLFVLDTPTWFYIDF